MHNSVNAVDAAELCVVKMVHFRGAWVGQSVKRLTLGFGSGHELMVVRVSPTSGSGLSAESA